METPKIYDFEVYDRHGPRDAPQKPKIKIPQLLTFENLENLRQQMKAPLITVTRPTGKISDPDEDITEDEGIFKKIEIDGVFLKHNGKRVLIYIKEPRGYSQNYSMPRFHFADCQTYQTMKNNGRKERYVVSSREDEEFHIINPLTSQEQKVKLPVCQHCLEKINYKGFPANKIEIVTQFSVSELRRLFPEKMIKNKPKKDEFNPSRDMYPENWNDIARTIKETVNWKCQDCGIDLSNPQHHKFLHVHHIDSRRSNNYRSNLKALCVRCHAKQYNHGHMKTREDYKQFIQEFGERN